jgi:hypothetical protein
MPNGYGAKACLCLLGLNDNWQYSATMIRDRPNQPPVTGNQREPMERVRLGVTGLAAVLLLVLLATAIASGVRRSANATDAALPATTGAPNAAIERTEPLAQLGVAPPAEDKTAPPPVKPTR